MAESSVSWERQKDEPLKAYKYFCYYRDLGTDRTLEKVRKHYDINFSNVKNYSQKYQWLNRCKAYDDYLESKIREANEKELIKTSKDQLKTINDLLRLFRVPLEIIDEQLNSDQQNDFHNMSLVELSSWVLNNADKFEKLVKLKRLLGGKSTQNIESQITEEPFNWDKIPQKEKELLFEFAEAYIKNEPKAIDVSTDQGDSTKTPLRELSS